MVTTSPHPQNPSDELTRGLGRIILSETDIQGRITELAAQISADYAGRNPLLIGVLRGVVFFMSDLLRAITIPVRLDFIAISRYAPQGGGKGPVRLVKDLEETIEGQHLIFVEDVIDTGLTLSYLLRLLRARGPASIEVCTLLNKPAHRLTNIPLKYKGFDLPDRFVVGYGLDYREAYRHLPYVAELRPETVNLA
jgi:hypoxanthine phosphoribosyltransferase